MGARTEARWVRMLDEFEGALGEKDLGPVVASLVSSLERERASTDSATWQRRIEATRAHPLWQRLLEDPYVARIYAKPRGYAGDAGVLDMIYFGLEAAWAHERGVTELGRRLFPATLILAEAVRERRRRLAQLVDSTACAHPGARILSVAGGFLREASLSKQVHEGRVSRWISIDQDAACAREILTQRAFLPCLQPIRTSVRRLLAGDVDLGASFHLIYAAGLFDYLDDEVARLLIGRLLDRLHPGGRLLVPNFAVGWPVRGYMEAIADWWLIYRTRADLEDLVPDHRADLASARVYGDDSGRSLYAELTRG